MARNHHGGFFRSLFHTWFELGCAQASEPLSLHTSVHSEWVGILQAYWIMHCAVVYLMLGGTIYLPLSGFGLGRPVEVISGNRTVYIPVLNPKPAMHLTQYSQLVPGCWLPRRICCLRLHRSGYGVMLLKRVNFKPWVPTWSHANLQHHPRELAVQTTLHLEGHGVSHLWARVDPCEPMRSLGPVKYKKNC